MQLVGHVVPLQLLLKTVCPTTTFSGVSCVANGLEATVLSMFMPHKGHR